MNIRYVTYLPDGTLDGCYFQEVRIEHAGRYIKISDTQAINWTSYKANAKRDGLEVIVQVTNLDQVIAEKNTAINNWRATANLSFFTHLDKQISCDALSRSDIDGIANHISLSGAFPVGFPHVWKAMDNTLIPMDDVDDFKAMYSSMAAQGAANFNHSQALKQALAKAVTLEDVAAIVW